MTTPNSSKKRSKKDVNLALDFGKLQPQAIELEAAIISTLLQYDNDDTHYVITVLQPEDFYIEKHAHVFEMIHSLFEKNIIPDVLTVTEECKKYKENVFEDIIGGPYGIAILCNAKPSLGNVKYYSFIVRQKYIQREIINLSSETTVKAFDDKTDVFNLIDDLQDKLHELTKGHEKANKLVEATNVADDFILDVDDEEIQQMQWKTGWPKFDDKVAITKSKILMIAAAAKAGKTKFVTALLSRLFEDYTNIACYWVTLEDSAKDILACYLSSKILMKPKYILRRSYQAEMKPILKQHIDKFKSFDIQFQEQSAKIKEVSMRFEKFCKQRKGKLCILIIDNILSLSDKEDFKANENSMYDYIMYEMLRCKQSTNGLIIPIHHYKDAQQYDNRLEKGYRPVLSDMKGTEAFRRTPNQVLLLNNPGKYPDLMNDYTDEAKEILKHIFIVDVGANREDTSDDETALIHFFHTLDFSIFDEIS